MTRSEAPYSVKVVLFTLAPAVLALPDLATGSLAFPTGSARSSEKHISGLLNSTLWRILAEQLELTPHQIQLLRRRPQFPLSTLISLDSAHQSVRIYTRGIPVPSNFPPLQESTAVWVNPYHPPANLVGESISLADLRSLFRRSAPRPQSSPSEYSAPQFDFPDSSS